MFYDSLMRSLGDFFLPFCSNHKFLQLPISGAAKSCRRKESSWLPISGAAENLREASMRLRADPFPVRVEY